MCLDCGKKPDYPGGSRHWENMQTSNRILTQEASRFEKEETCGFLRLLLSQYSHSPPTRNLQVQKDQVFQGCSPLIIVFLSVPRDLVDHNRSPAGPNETQTDPRGCDGLA
ncbi:unnamed protein product [Pleuronectes platessa]|uniref:Uncharacterized protein n=1 Tax=Pleuronectes platessa TaxID=8262 RepID=A0A9N7U6C1_PLEPL|nr:unnamed protein product [Pleuronectes platessa]